MRFNAESRGTTYYLTAQEKKAYERLPQSQRLIYDKQLSAYLKVRFKNDIKSVAQRLFVAGEAYVYFVHTIKSRGPNDESIKSALVSNRGYLTKSDYPAKFRKAYQLPNTGLNSFEVDKAYNQLLKDFSIFYKWYWKRAIKYIRDEANNIKILGEILLEQYNIGSEIPSGALQSLGQDLYELALIIKGKRDTEQQKENSLKNYASQSSPYGFGTEEVKRQIEFDKEIKNYEANIQHVIRKTTEEHIITPAVYNYLEQVYVEIIELYENYLPPYSQPYLEKVYSLIFLSVDNYLFATNDKINYELDKILSKKKGDWSLFHVTLEKFKWELFPEEDNEWDKSLRKICDFTYSRRKAIDSEINWKRTFFEVGIALLAIPASMGTSLFFRVLQVSLVLTEIGIAIQEIKNIYDVIETQEEMDKAAIVDAAFQVTANNYGNKEKITSTAFLVLTLVGAFSDFRALAKGLRTIDNVPLTFSKRKKTKEIDNPINSKNREKEIPNDSRPEIISVETKKTEFHKEKLQTSSRDSTPSRTTQNRGITSPSNDIINHPIIKNGETAKTGTLKFNRLSSKTAKTGGIEEIRGWKDKKTWEVTVQIKGKIKPEIGRKEYQRDIKPAIDYGFVDFDRAHLWGANFGDEASAGIMYAPSGFNKGTQKRIENFINSVAKDPTIKDLQLTATAKSYSKGFITKEVKRIENRDVTFKGADYFLKEVTYEVSIIEKSGKKFRWFELSAEMPNPVKGGQPIWSNPTVFYEP